MTDEKKMAYLIDMDGTLYRGSSPIEHAKEFIQYLKMNNRKFLLATNCPGSTTGDLVKKLALMNIEAAEEDILTSGQVTASYISANKIASRVYVIGSKALEEEFIKKGVEVVQDNPDYVVVGFDRNFSYEKMEKAIRYINRGAGFIITNGDFTIPEGNEFIPHTGAIAAGIERATGVVPLVMGKPGEHFLAAAQGILMCSREECCVIGDRLDTDIAMGANLGIASYLVMTGVTTNELLEESPFKPTKAFEDLRDLMMFDRESM
jgi:4-nitrophenyl phosphatase